MKIEITADCMTTANAARVMRQVGTDLESGYMGRKGTIGAKFSSDDEVEYEWKVTD